MSTTLRFGFNSLRLKSARRNARDSPLLRLPAEIRASIWKHALEYPVVKVRPSSKRHRKSVRVNFGLLRICRQVYSETARLPHTLNTFSFSTHDDVTNFARRKKLDKLQKLSVRSNWITHSLDLVRSVLYHREHLPQLQEVELTMHDLPRSTDEKPKSEETLRSLFKGIRVRIHDTSS